MTENGTTVAMSLLGSPCFPVSWGSRIRLLSTASSARSRYTSVKWVPAYRWNAQLFREYSAIRAALRAPSMSAPMDAMSDWPPKSVRHLQPFDAIVGTPGPTQSVLVRFVEPETGRPHAVVKMMVSREAGTAERIAAESQAIQDPKLDGLVPMHWETGVIDKHHYLVTEFVTGPSMAPGERGMMIAMNALKSKNTNSNLVDIADHPWIQRNEKRAYWLKKERLIGRFPVVRMHGDFAPWNVLVQSRKNVVLIDWEFSEDNGIGGVDLAHYLLVTQHLLKRRDPRRAIACAIRELNRIGGYSEREALTLIVLATTLVLMREPYAAFREEYIFWNKVIKFTHGSHP